MSVQDSLQGAPGAQAGTVEPAKRSFDFMALLANRTFQLTLVLVVALVFCFGPLVPELKKRWLDMDSYYAHGLLMPLCAAYLVWDRWDRIKGIPVKGAWWALLPLGAVLWVSLVASRAIMPSLLSVLLVATVALGVLFVAGWKWLMALLPAVLFLTLGLPIFDRVIDQTTMPLQIMSTNVAYVLLKVFQFNPIRFEPTVIFLDNFHLYVAAACSGLKTTIAITAAVIFFMLIARLKWWANLILAAVAIPLSVLINGIRIFLIGIVGNSYGSEAGMQFHDYSGYIALLLCFLILGWMSKKLGYK